MIKIAVIEDELEASDKLTNCLKKYSKSKNIEINIIVFDNGDSFLDSYKSNYDLIFLDIELPTINGIEVAKRIRKIDNVTSLIFVTNMAQYAVKGYEVNAFDFIVKPFEYSIFVLKMDRIVANINMKSDIKVKIKTSKGIYSVSTSSIIYIESIGHHIIFHLTDENLESYGILNNIEEDIKEKGFIRSNSCYLCNLRYVSGIEKDDLIINDTRLAISRSKKKDVIRAINNYLGGND